MSALTKVEITYNEPRTIWALSLQLIYTIVAMLPFYYYMRELAQIPAEGRYLLQFLPVAVGILLFFVELRLNSYFWKQEKILINRDIVPSTIKSILVTLVIFYLIFFFLLAYVIGRSGFYENFLGISDNITIIVLDLGFTFLVLLFTTSMMLSIQEQRLSARSIASRLRRK